MRKITLCLVALSLFVASPAAAGNGSKPPKGFADGNKCMPSKGFADGNKGEPSA